MSPLINTEIVQVTAAVLTDDKRVLIAKRKPSDKLANKWEFPGGKIKNGETPQQCLRREIQEEFNIDIQVGRYLGSSIYHYDHISIELLAFLSSWGKGTICLNDHAEYAWVSAEEIARYDFAPADLPFVDMVRRGKVEL